MAKERAVLSAAHQLALLHPILSLENEAVCRLLIAAIVSLFFFFFLSFSFF
jgi:hypothetical protein